jgi:hypothetical protein
MLELRKRRIGYIIFRYMKRKKTKKLSPREQHHLAHLRAGDQAPLMRDKYPVLASLSIRMEFKRPLGQEWMGDIASDLKMFEPEKENKAFFEFECPDSECVGGGFDLSRVVHLLVKTRAGEVSNTMLCRGWEDEERMRSRTSHCGLELKYTIVATYVNEARVGHEP